MISNVTKPHRDLHWMIKLLLLIQRFFEQYLSENIIHFVIDQPSTALCTKLQVLSSDFSEISDLLNEHWPKNVPKESRSTPICVWLMICVDQNFAVKNIDESFLQLTCKSTGEGSPWLIQQWKYRRKKNQFKLQSFGYLSALFSPHITTY